MEQLVVTLDSLEGAKLSQNLVNNQVKMENIIQGQQGDTEEGMCVSQDLKSTDGTFVSQDSDRAPDETFVSKDSKNTDGTFVSQHSEKTSETFVSQDSKSTDGTFVSQDSDRAPDETFVSQSLKSSDGTSVTQDSQATDGILMLQDSRILDETSASQDLQSIHSTTESQSSQSRGTEYVSLSSTNSELKKGDDREEAPGGPDSEEAVTALSHSTDCEEKMDDCMVTCPDELTIGEVSPRLNAGNDGGSDQCLSSARSYCSACSMDKFSLSEGTRDNVASPMSQTSQHSQQEEDDVTRLGVESALYREDSSMAWLRQACMASNSSLGSGQEREEEFVSARESPASNTSGDSGPDSGRAVELVNSLVEGPCITLPPSQLPIISLQTETKASPTQLPPVSVTTTETVSTFSQSPKVMKESDYSTAQVKSGTEESSVVEPASQYKDTQTSVGQNITPRVAALKAMGEERPSSTSHVVEERVTKTDSPTSRPNSTPVEGTPTEKAHARPRVKKTPNDFIFGKVIGEGSYSTVYLAKEVSTQTEFAIKVCDKKHLIRERKTHFVMREKEVLMKLDHPFFIKLAYTFQDPDRLYYVLTYARNGELLGYLHKLSAFDVSCTRFYTAEIVLALEYLHSLGIIHRDLKPENILLSADMHIKITDFGTSKILSADSKGEGKRKNSFVGTAEYVSPEVLNNQPANYGSDLWGLGCIIYQCLSGSLPFRSGNEYQTFQKIIRVEYDFPEGFYEPAKDLVTKLLVLEPSERLGMVEPEGMSALKAHPFYDCIEWDTLPQATPPKLMPYLPATGSNPEFWGQEQRTGFDDQRLAEIITGQAAEGTQSPELEEVTFSRPASEVEEEKRQAKLRRQRLENQFHPFVEDNLILKQGFVDKRKGLFARKRMLLLTEGPHLYYVDAHNKVLKGEIPWSEQLRPEAKNFKIFFVHTPNRTYYLESRSPDAHLWVKKIEEVRKKYYGN